ncbi:tetratricopeptide repeat protein [bacterium]|nr:tetratricopeptide repeat protein [bacterium]
MPTLAVVASLRPGCPLGAGWKKPLELLPYDLAAARDTFHARSSEIYLGDPDLDGLLKELDGWPIAVTVLARRTGEYPRAKDLAEAWRTHHSALLVSGSSRRDADLGACVGLSLAHPRMNDAAKRLLGLLALSPDGIDQDDMNKLLPGEGNPAAATLRAVGGLTTDEYYRLKDRDRPRMWMPAPLRDYIGTRFPASNDDQNRWVRLYCRRCRRMGNQIGDKGSAGVVQRFRAELGNTQEAIRLGLTGVVLAEACMGAAGLGQLGYITSVDVRPILRQAAAAALRLRDRGLAADCLLNLGRIALTRSDMSELQVAAERALTLSRQSKWISGEAQSTCLLADLADCRSDHTIARALIGQAATMYHRIRDVQGEANCAYMMSRIAIHRREYTDGLRRAQEAQVVYRRIGELLGEANCLAIYGSVALGRYEYAEATQHLRAAISLYQEVGNTGGPADCFRGLGDIYLGENKLAEAEDQYMLAREICEQIDLA